VKLADGISANYGRARGYIAGTNTNRIFAGDVLSPSVAGVLNVFTAPSAGPVAGIAEDFEWVSLSLGQVVRRKWWPGTGDVAAGQQVTVYYSRNPMAVYEVQCLLGPITSANIGQYANFAVGAGGQQIGAGNMSSFTLNDAGLTDTPGTLPFRVFDLPVAGVYAPLATTSGYDQTQQYNRVYVTINSAQLSPE
jgi:hypothetical protein